MINKSNSGSSDEGRLSRILLNASLFITGMLLFYLVGRLGYSPWTWVLCIFLIVSTVLNILLRRASVGSRLPGIALSLAVLNLFLLVPELSLRAVDFRYESGVDFAPSREAFLQYKPDPELLWRWHERYELNSLGYPSPEPDLPKPEGRFRVMVVGDSCSWDSYPDMTKVILQQQYKTHDRSIDLVNLALPGYSSFQGRILVEKYTDVLEPDVVVVMFGWNDHWPAFGAIDAEKEVHIQQGLAARTFSAIYERIRLIQGVFKVIALVNGNQQPLQKVRVPLHQFEQNHRWIGTYLRENGIPVIFMTAPTSFYQFGVPRRLYESSNFGSDAEVIVERHRAFAQMLRDIAQSEKWALLDLEKRLADHPSLEDLFWKDGIHYSPEGKAVIAALLAEKLDTVALSN